MLIGRPARRIGQAIWGLPSFVSGVPRGRELLAVSPPVLSFNRWREISRRRALVPVIGYSLSADSHRPRVLTSDAVVWLAAVYAVVPRPPPRVAYFALIYDEECDPVHVSERDFDAWFFDANLPRGTKLKRGAR